jgi:hypothetical protein
MKIALRCEKCREITMGEEDSPCLEIDFYAKKMTFICKNKKCRHENTIDFGDWQDKQKHSPLPPTRVM